MKQKEEMTGTHIKLSTSRKIFLAADYLFLTCSALLCLLPLINVLAVSLSSSCGRWSSPGRPTSTR